ncbi:MAG: helix-turn-helix transcriptional regulator [Aurantimonas endophytica]|uniref:helix-turn-helix transcriptional regulator n=1 Tax=Aurantimonas endophytica TaxID=1522175 RepID=UPI00300125D4
MKAFIVNSPGLLVEDDSFTGFPTDCMGSVAPSGDRHSLLAAPIDLGAAIPSAGPSCWTFGDVVFTRSISPAGDGATPRHDRHDRWRVVLARSPSALPTSLPPEDAQQGRLTFHAPDSPCEGLPHPGELLTLLLPKDFCRDAFEFPGSAPDIDPELESLLAGFMENLARQLPHISPDHFHGLAAATRSLVAACIVPRPERLETAAVPFASLLIDQARLVVRRNMACPEFGPCQLARSMAMSRSKLYRLFENAGGVPHFINRERLREAHRSLTESPHSHSIHIIASEVGYTDHSTFSRAFRREFGYTPTEARDRGIARLSANRIGPAPHDAQPNTTFSSAAAPGSGDGLGGSQLFAAIPASRQG